MISRGSLQGEAIGGVLRALDHADVESSESLRSISIG